MAKIDSAGLQGLIVKASEENARLTIFASRSGEWEEARSHFIKECFGSEPKIVRICPLEAVEQQQIFEGKFPNVDFGDFCQEIERFELSPLLGNPQFLLIFAEAYVQAGGHFSTKRQIFADAVRGLTVETNRAVAKGDRLSDQKIIEISEEIFAKLLLSGSVGVSLSDGSEEVGFPSLQSLMPTEFAEVSQVLDTRLFKPSDHPDLHEPVHRIIAEYCAASYLARRMGDVSDALSVSRCSSIIAPNSVLRDELRGLAGWIAALGSRTVQETMVKLDPYAVLSNGDPSLLDPSTKVLLLDRLFAAAEVDPYFRRSDQWRSFSVAGFFADDIVAAIREKLASSGDDTHLRGLLLELLVGSDVVAEITEELRETMLDGGNSDNTRTLAFKCLAAENSYDFGPDFDSLVVEGGESSLALASRIAIQIGVEGLGRTRVLGFLRSCETLFAPRGDRFEIVSGKYRVKDFIFSLELPLVEWLLDQIALPLVCTCGKKKFQCDCRIAPGGFRREVQHR